MWFPMFQFRPSTAATIAVLSLLAITCATAPAMAGNAPVGGGGSCSYSTEGDGTVGQQQAYDDGLYTCLSSSSTWTPEAFMVGSVLQTGSAATCSSTYAGMLQWTGSAFQGCNGTSWITFSGSGGGSRTVGFNAPDSPSTNPIRRTTTPHPLRDGRHPPSDSDSSASSGDPLTTPPDRGPRIGFPSPRIPAADGW